MDSIFDNSIIKRVLTAGYVGKDHYEIVLHNGSSIYVTDRHEMQVLQDTINETKQLCEKYDAEEVYYEVLTSKLQEKGW